MVTHPGHPLVGRSLPVARRYRERGERLWVIELPDGSRQYIPAAWCTPLATAESAAVTHDRHGVPQQPKEGASPLSLAGLRDLAALVRRLQGRVAARGGEPNEDVGVAREETPGEADPGRKVAALGELSPGGPTPPGPFDRPGCPAPGQRATGGASRGGAEVTEP